MRWYGSGPPTRKPFVSMNKLWKMWRPDGPEITPDTPVYEAMLGPEECGRLTEQYGRVFNPRYTEFPVIVIEWNGRYLIDGRNRCSVAWRDGKTIPAYILRL